MKIMVVGDTHGGTNTVKRKIDIAKEVGGIDRMLICGDFGLWWRYEGVQFIDEINEYARARNFYVFALPGNHENYDWWNATIATAPTSKGFAYLRTNVLLSPRVHEWRWAGKQFAIAGGAVSIDKAWRIQHERETGDRVWSSDEQLTDNEVDLFLEKANGLKIDYFFTHDCSNMTPWKGRLKPDFDSQMHRQRIDRILRGTQPRVHFHGHMHERYEWENLTGDDHWTITYGLECNDDPYSWGVLDTKTDEFRWSKTVLADAEANRAVEV